jgi:transcriptional regulator with XRE-family HTH domain
MKIDTEQIDKNILLARTIKGFSQEGLANKLGHSQQRLQKVEKAEIDLTFEQINRFSEALEVSPQFLLFSTPSQVLNNCFNNSALSETGNFSNCVVNTPEILERIAGLQKLFETYLSKNA